MLLKRVSDFEWNVEILVCQFISIFPSDNFHKSVDVSQNSISFWVDFEILMDSSVHFVTSMYYKNSS